MVSWNDPGDRYRTKLEYVEDSSNENFGYKELECELLAALHRDKLSEWDDGR